VPSVTTILGAVIAKPHLVGWANRLGLQGIKVGQYVDELADVGTAVHELCKADLFGRKPDLPPLTAEQLDMVTASYGKFLDWRQAWKVRPIIGEVALVSESLRYGGTPDCLAEVEDADMDPGPALAVLDFKTGKAVYDDYGYQLAGYVHLYREQGHDVSRGYVVRIGRTADEGFEVVRFSGQLLELCWTVFQNAVRIYYAKQRIEALGREPGPRRALLGGGA
jgi:hypothetical protein